METAPIRQGLKIYLSTVIADIIYLVCLIAPPYILTFMSYGVSLHDPFVVKGIDHRVF